MYLLVLSKKLEGLLCRSHSLIFFLSFPPTCLLLHLCSSNLAAPTTLNFNLCLFNSVRPPILFLFLFQIVNWDSHLASHVYFPSLRHHSPALPVAQCLEIISSYNFPNYSCLWQERKSFCR